MLIELRTLERRKANYIRKLQQKGKLKPYLSPNGYIAYDTDEYANRPTANRRGRPPKHYVIKEN